MTDIDLDAIRARAEAATAGPWHAWDRGIGFEVHIGAECFADAYESDEQCWELNSGMRETFEPTDAEFIAHARTDVPALIAEVERLRTLLKPECGGPECKVVPMHYVDSCPTHQEDGGGFWYEGDGETWADA